MKLKNLLITTILILSIGACKKDKPIVEPIDPVVTPYVTDNSFKIVAYMPSYKDPETVDIGKYKMITHLFYAFLNISSAGDGSLNAFTTIEASRFNTVKTRATANGVKFGISVSGTSTNFATMASSAATRAKFINNVIIFAKTNNLAGVDIDWEYPSTTTGIASADNFTLLMKELSVVLHKEGMFLSAAVTPAVYAGGVRDGVKPDVFSAIDFFNIMQYDGPGYDTAEPLNHASYKMSVASLDIWLGTKGLPREKAIVGIPLYGENLGGATSKAYRDIEASGADVNLNVANVNGVDFGYNGILLIKQKTQLAKDRANGIMFWEFSFDSNSSKSLIKAANDQLGRTY